jgi:hypothetical protein
VRPRNSNLEPSRPEFPRPPRMPRWLLIVSVVTMLAVLSVGYVSLRVVQRIRQFKSLASEIQTAYQAADSLHSFTPQEGPAMPQPDRIKAYLRARERFFAGTPPEVEARAHNMLERRRTAAPGDAIRLIGAFHEFLREGSRMHLAALEEAAMGPSEFLWIHALVVRGVLDAPEGDLRRQRLEEVLTALELSAAPVPGSTQSFSSKDFQTHLRRQLTDFPALDPLLFEEYRIESDLMACLDIIAATEKIHHGLGLKARTTLAAPQASLDPATHRELES